MDTTIPNNPACRSFRANLWRPHTCTHCYKSKSLHHLQSDTATSKGLFRKRTCPAKISPKSPKPSRKELRQVASTGRLERATKQQWEEDKMPQRSSNGGPMVGVVKPYAVVDIDKEEEAESEESCLDGNLKRRYSEPSLQVNKVSTTTNTDQPNSSNTLSVAKVKSQMKSSSNQSLDKMEITGEANLLDSVPKPARVIGRLLNEYHRSLSVTSIDKPPTDRDAVESSKRQNRGRSVEPLETHRTRSITVARSSSLRQEAHKPSKFRAINLLTRRKATAIQDVKPLESKSQHSTETKKETSRPVPSDAFVSGPKVTSPHPVRRNKATIHVHALPVTIRPKNQMKVAARPRAMTIGVKSSGESPTLVRESSLKKRKRTPPEKPPRTLSTFFSSTEQEELFRQLLLNGDIEDVVMNRMSNELRAAANKPTHPPPRSRPGDYTEVRPRGEAVGNQCVSRLPLGHSGDYAEVFSKSGSTSTSGMTGSVESDYDSLEQYSPPTPPPRPSFELVDTNPQPTDPTPSQPHTSTPSQPHPSTPSQPHPSTPSQPHPSTPSQLHPSTTSQDDPDSYYSLPFVSPMEDSTTVIEQDVRLQGDQLQPVASPTRVNQDLNTLMINTLEALWQREEDTLVYKEDTWGLTDWDELEVISESEAKYKGKTFSIKAIQSLSNNLQKTIKISKLLTPHVHLTLVRSLLAPPLTTLTPLTPSPHYLLTDHTGVDGTSFLLPQRSTLTPTAYTDLILHTLTQLFTALKFLYSNGICHRDVGMECLYGRKVKGHWLASLGDFNYALQRSGPVNATTFVYGYHELEWLGGVDTRLPPEVIDTPDNAQTVDYAHTDSFSAGCMIYELCSHGNPFETDPELIFRQYSDEDLPALDYCESKNSKHLQKLATLLVRREPTKRISSSTALLICQALQWLPEEWLRGPPPESQVKTHLFEERARLVCELARREESSVPLDQLLRAKFLLECDVSELIRTLSVFSH